MGSEAFYHYLYGHHCTIFMDHEALKNLLNTAHPSGKLARWGMALQELDLKIEYRQGKANARADALSRYPISLLASNGSNTQIAAVVAKLDIASSHVESVEGRTLEKRQKEDPSPAAILAYLHKRELPEEEKAARELVLGESMYMVIDGVMYHVQRDKALRIIPPTADRRKCFLEAHEGPFSGHLRVGKMYSQLCRYYLRWGVRNTTVYHPQTDGLVEQFNRTLTDMLAKRRGNGDKEWDEILPYALFAYQSTEQVSTGESPFHLLYGRNPQLPTETALNPPIQRELISLHDYHTTMTQRMGEMWTTAQRNIRRAQRRQKHYHDHRAREEKFKVEERAFVHTPTLKSGPVHKLVSPGFHPEIF